MGYRDIWPFSSLTGSALSVQSAPMTAAETFLPGELVSVVAAGTVTAVHQNGAQFVLSDVISPHACGVALNGPGLTTATAEKPASQGYGRLWVHPDSGESYANTGWKGTQTGVGSPRIWYYPFDENTLFVTSIVITAGGATAGAAFTGADRGDIFQITYCSGPTPDVGWGLERTVGVQGTDFGAEIVDVIDALGNSVSISGTGTRAVFRVLI